jgi:protein-disulfide isomerase
MHAKIGEKAAVGVTSRSWRVTTSGCLDRVPALPPTHTDASSTDEWIVHDDQINAERTPLALDTMNEHEMTDNQTAPRTDKALSDGAQGHSQGQLFAPITAWDHQLGPADAPVTLVEYGDYECPRCAAAHRIIERVRLQLGDRLRIVYRHFPDPQVHSHAQPAAEAAELAGAQSPDAFWAMHALLYANQDQLTDEDLRRYAADLDLDMMRFERGFTDHVFAAKVAEDKQGGVRSGVTGTPTIFLNGTRYDGPIELEALEGAVLRAAKNGSATSTPSNHAS